jgi:transposase
MARAYSLDLRERVVAAVLHGLSCRAVAVRFDVSVASVVKWAQRARETGSPAARPMGGKRPYLLAGQRSWLLARLDEKPDLTLHTLLRELGARGVTVSCDTLWRFLRREGFSFKKSVAASEQERPDVARRRAVWKRFQARLAPERLVFLDETWTKTNMSPLRGWRRRGERLHAKVPHGHWKTLTFVAALRCGGIDAPCVFDGPINGESFKAYVEHVLAPVLRPGDIIVMDNLGSHKGSAIRRAIRAAGAHLLFLPPYSPDLNPIEQVFAKLKTLLRKAEERTVDGLWRRIGGLLDTFTPGECANYLQNAGYASI